MITLFILALFLASVRWLRLSRVRALRLLKQATHMGTHVGSVAWEINSSIGENFVQYADLAFAQVVGHGTTFGGDGLRINQNNHRAGESFIRLRRAHSFYGKLPGLEKTTRLLNRIERFGDGVHNEYSASARARRQGTGVLDRPEKRQTLKLEAA